MDGSIDWKRVNFCYIMHLQAEYSTFWAHISLVMVLQLCEPDDQSDFTSACHFYNAIGIDDVC
eukprot:scaffold120172_cov22-Prasinocladus_malaysianus.AAC.1